MATSSRNRRRRWQVLVGCALVLLVRAVSAASNAPAAAPAFEPGWIWLRVEVASTPVGWAAERITQSPGGLRLQRRSAIGGSREALDESLGPNGVLRMRYQRYGRAQPVRVRFDTAGRSWQLGDVREDASGPLAEGTLPVGLLRALSVEGEVALLLEECGVVDRGQVRRERERDGSTTLRYRVGGLEESVRLGPGGRLVAVESPAARVRAVRSVARPPQDVIDQLLAPPPAPPPVRSGGFVTATAPLVADARRLASVEAILSHVRRSLPHRDDDRYRRAEEVWRRRQGDCTGRAVYAHSLLAAAGYVVRHVAGFTRLSPREPWLEHEWLEVFEVGRWRAVDPDGRRPGPGSHRAVVRFDPSPRAILGAELRLLAAGQPSP